MTKYIFGLSVAMALLSGCVPDSISFATAEEHSPASRQSALKLDLEEAIQMINDRKLLLLQMDFLGNGLSPGSLSRRSQPTIQGEKLAQLKGLLQAALKARPAFNRTRTLAQIDFAIEPTRYFDEKSAAKTDLYGEVQGTTAGFGEKFSKAMFTAAETLDSGDLEKFVRGMYPMDELARVTKGDQLKRLVFRLTQNPEMARTMTRDLHLVANSRDVSIKKTAGSPNSVAIVRLPPGVRNGKAREYRFELVDGHWRFFDSLRDVRAEHKRLLSAPVPGYTIPGRQITLMMQWQGYSWRLVGEPMERPIPKVSN